ncbi:hypothetical protein [Chitinophaga japonensis]|nr:hypothetical protein [Chitinophaga japonensis]
MFIFDSNGKKLEITDLNAALKQADLFRYFHHDDPAFAALDRELSAYWQDVYDKLLELGNVKNATP